MEQLSGEVREDFLERLADHWSKAGDETRAVEYLLRLADEASERYAVDAAIRLLKQAHARAAALAAGPRERLRLDAAFRLAQALFFVGRPRETVELLIGEQSTTVQVNDSVLTARYHVWLGQAYGFLDETEQAMRHAGLALRAAARSDDALATGIAHFVLARTCNRLGRGADGIEHARAAIALLEKVDEPTWLGYAYWALGLNLGHLGRYHENLDVMTRVREIADETGDARLQAYAAWTTSWSYIALCDHASAIAWCRRAVEVAPDALHRAAALTYLGAAFVEAHVPASAIEALEESLQLLDQFEGFAYLKAYASLNLGTAYLQAGDLDRAHARALIAFEQATRSRWTLCLGRTQRLLGLVAAARGDAADAHGRLREAIGSLESVGAQTELGISEMILAEMLCATDAREAMDLGSRASARLRALGLEELALKAEALSRAAVRA
jgi:tetratricopeptide (TPR) repeat protein